MDKNGKHAISISVSAFIEGSARKVWRSAEKEYPWIDPDCMQHARSANSEPLEAARAPIKEVLAGKVVEAEGTCLYSKEGEVAIWSGIYTFPIFPGLKLKLHCDSILRARKDSGGVLLEYNDFIYFGRSLLGRMLIWYFKKVLKSDVAIHNHNTLKLFALRIISGS
ncbi:MAG: hypothetical protein QXT36_01810 [Candidatus Micrarchaeaceae archaeon]